MIVTVDFGEILAMIGGVVVCGFPLVIGLALYANFGVYRKRDKLP